MEQQLKLSEIVKYLLLGAISIFSIDISTLYFYDINLINFLNINYLGNLIEDKTLVISILMLALSYLFGLLIHTMNELMIFIYRNSSNKAKYYQTLSIPKYGMNNKGRIEIMKYINICIKSIFSAVYRCTIDEVCIRLHNNGSKSEIHSKWIPSWVSLSYHPEWVLNLIAEKMAQHNKGTNSEFLYLHEFITGLRSSLIILSIIACTSLIHNFNAYKHVIIFMVAVIAVWGILSYIAKIFAIKYIIHINSCYEIASYGTEINNKNKENMRNILYKSGIPCAYIMVRTTFKAMNDPNNHFADNIADCILSQDYPNISVIVYEDLGEATDSAKESKKKEKVYNNPIVKKLRENQNINVIYCADHLGSAAKSALEIRKVFIDSATDDDVAILLDDDDEFTSSDTISNIMLKMAQYNANICLIGFNEISNRGLSIIHNRKDYEELLQDITQLNRSVTYRNIPDLHRAATMGWTKCYKREVLQTYCNHIENCDKFREKYNRNKEEEFQLKSFEELKAYEDFPDYICLLFPNSKIVAINQSIYNYQKQSDSITANCTVDSFDIQRIGFLIYTQHLFILNHNNIFTKDAKQSLDDFIKYKLDVIKHLLQDKITTGEIKEYSVDKFNKSYEKQRKIINNEQ